MSRWISNLTLMFTVFTLIVLGNGCTGKQSMSFSSSASTLSNSTAQKMMTRTLVSSALIDIFGPSVAPVTQVYISPVGNAFVLGGPCDNYAGDCPAGDTSSMSTQAPLQPGAIASREAAMVRTCDLIASNDTAIRYAAAQARNVVILSQNFSLPTNADVNPPSASELAVAYDLFYAGKTPDPNVILSLQTLSQKILASEGLPLESWRFVFLTLCLAPDWQIP